MKLVPPSSGAQDPRRIHKGLRTPQDEGGIFLQNAGIGLLGDASHATKPELEFIIELSHSDCKLAFRSANDNDLGNSTDSFY
jgi:hypothetical protein